MSGKPQMRLPTVVSVALETNGKGYMGFIVELPGAFVRGKTEEEAIAKVDREVNAYLRWLRMERRHDYTIKVVQVHTSALMVEDADNEILLDADKGMLDQEEYQSLRKLVWDSGETFFHLSANSEFKDWIDQTRIRKTFYGENPKTIREIFDHVKGCQYYYLSRARATFEEKEEDFLKIREFCLAEIDKIYRESNNSLIFDVDGELWTLKKILRRFIWHDRIHGKAITRILEKQRQLGVIERFSDPFHFMEATP